MEEHLNLLESGRALIKQVSEDPRIKNAAKPTLFHPDLHKRNIFVSNDDPTTITAIIDWQSAAIEPAFWYADEIPDFARPIPHPSVDGQFEPNSELCAKAFDACTRFLVPTLADSRLMDETLFRPFRYCYRTWRDGATAFRHELIETAHRWKELGLAGSCPFYTPTPKRLTVHQEKYQRFVASRELRSILSSLLNVASDGWAPPEDWETVEKSHKELFDGMLQAVLRNEAPSNDEPIRNEEDLKEIWPFDLGHVS